MHHISIFECMSLLTNYRLVSMDSIEKRIRVEDLDRCLSFDYNKIIVPAFDTKVTEYLCSGVFFSSDKFRLFN